MENWFLKQEVYVNKPPGFENTTIPNHVSKLNKGLYNVGATFYWKIISKDKV